MFDTKTLCFYSYNSIDYTDLNDNNSKEKKPTTSIKEFQDRFEKFMNDFEEKGKANAIFSIIINCLPIKLIRLHDLTFSFNSIKQSKTILVSLVDYISTLLSETDVVTIELLCLHRYLSKSCCIPRIFIKNKQFK